MADKPQVITVKVAQPGEKEPYKVILWETSPEHVSKDNAEGEIFISSDDKQYRVGETPAIKKLLMEGVLTKVEGKAADKPDDKSKPKAAPWDGFDNHTTEEIVARLQGSDKATRDKVLAYERANKKREDLIQILVNWNSGAS